ncbi:MAG TPA: hypothetical protein VGD37_40765 [Kofleriaceae bacterium]|jgi:hypothetical protein
MSDFQNEMNRTVQGFVAQITQLAHRAAIDTLESAFTGRGGGGGGGRNGSRAAAVLATVGPRGRARGGRGAKRTPADLEELSQKFAAFVKSHPGLRIEQINKELGTTTKDLALPIRKLIADGMISVKGKKRSTTYFVGRKGAKS